MAKQRQLWLPKVSRVKKLERNRKSPQPQLDGTRAIKQYEIFHRPFDLHFRGMLSEWLQEVKRRKNIDLPKILSQDQYKLINLYFFPKKPDKTWLNQEEVLKRVHFGNKRKLRQTLISALIRVWKKSK